MEKSASDSLNAKVIRPTLSETERYALVQKLTVLMTDMQLLGYDVTAKHLEHAAKSLYDCR